MQSRSNQIAILVALVLLIGSLVVYFSLGQSEDVDILPSGENELISLAKAAGSMHLVLDEEIDYDSICNQSLIHI